MCAASHGQHSILVQRNTCTLLWQVVAESREGKSAEDVRALLDAGVYDMQVLKDQGWVTDLKYADEVEELLKSRTGANWLRIRN